MTKGYEIERQEAEFEEAKEREIQSWIDNGASSTDARQLMDDMNNDPHHSDPDMSCHFDPTIDERLAKYSSKLA